MLLYLKYTVAWRQQAGITVSGSILDDAIRDGAVLCVRPKAMTVAVIIIGLLPIFWGHRTG
jgi:Cu(I)/Ag(I) efflux system membrane protein CusA/SilA